LVSHGLNPDEMKKAEQDALAGDGSLFTYFPNDRCKLRERDPNQPDWRFLNGLGCAS
jgi:hypothetical protein